MFSFLNAFLYLQMLKCMHNKTITEFCFLVITGITKASVCVIRLSLELRQITQNSRYNAQLLWQYNC